MTLSHYFFLSFVLVFFIDEIIMSRLVETVKAVVSSITYSVMKHVNTFLTFVNCHLQPLT